MLQQLVHLTGFVTRCAHSNKAGGMSDLYIYFHEMLLEDHRNSQVHFRELLKQCNALFPASLILLLTLQW